MTRTFLLFLAVGVVGWVCWYAAMEAITVSEAGSCGLFLFPLALSACAAGAWWCRGRRSFGAATAGLFLSGLLSFLYWFWFLVAEPSLRDFEARAVSSQWELTAVLFGVLCLLWTLSAGAGAAVGSRLRRGKL